jgi:hypothetical protein
LGSERKLRILTFLRHEPFMYELAKTGHRFDLILVDRTLWARPWDELSRPLPSNVETVGEAEDVASLDLDQYDLLLPQAYDDFELVQGSRAPKMVLFHSAASARSVRGLSRAEALRRLYQEWQLASIPIVYVSHHVAENWGLPGTVILHSLDVRDYEGFENNGKTAAVLTVAHFFKEREALGYPLHHQVVGDHIPHRIVGHNPSLPDVNPAKDWGELKGYYRDYRVYLNTTSWGGSLAMLEAMCAGMPVVTTPRPAGEPRHTSVIDGYNGFVSADPAELRRKVEFLLANPAVARAMGREGRETVLRKYGTQRFVQRWQEFFQDVVAPRPKERASPPAALLRTLRSTAQLATDAQASRGVALRWSGDAAGEYVLYGPFIRLPAGDHELEFYLRPWPGLDFAIPAIPMIHAALTSFRRRLVRRTHEVAVLDVCSGPDGKVRARRAVHVSDVRTWGSYQPFRLSFHSSAEKLFQFRVFVTGIIPLQVDPYATWASLRRAAS